MLSLPAVILTLCVASCVGGEGVRLHAKELIRGKVVGNGYSVTAKSLNQCIDHCNKRRTTCDGVVYHQIINKCRLINKCAPAFQVDNSTTAVYYSRRPQIKVAGYIHDPKSDTCLGVIQSQVDYESADRLCETQNAHLALLNERSLNDIASLVLVNAGASWAWIEEKNDPNVGDSIKPHGLSGNDVLSQEVFTPEVFQWRKNSTRSCWGLNSHGQWGQFSCKNNTMVALCQVSRFTV